MKVFYGIVSPERAVFSADTGPELENIRKLNGDWGPQADRNAIRNLALTMAMDASGTAYAYGSERVEAALRVIEADRPWILHEAAIRQIMEKYKVVQ